MIFSKKNVIFLLLVGLIGLSSCSKSSDDNSCIAPALSENIIGSWTTDYDPDSRAEFKTDGTLIDPNDIIFAGNINGLVLDLKTYSVTNQTVSIMATSSIDNSIGSLGAEFVISSNECAEIKFPVLGITVTLTRI